MSKAAALTAEVLSMGMPVKFKVADSNTVQEGWLVQVRSDTFTDEKTKEKETRPVSALVQLFQPGPAQNVLVPIESIIAPAPTNIVPIPSEGEKSLEA